MNNLFNVLYLDDEPINLRVFKATFKRDYNIFIAETPAEAFAIFEAENIHLVISDQRMPEMTGVQFLEVISKKYPDTIRIILTAFADMEDIIYAINRVGLFRYLTKPWENEDLKAAINSGLENQKLKIENAKLLEDLKEMNAEITEHSLIMAEINHDLDKLVNDLSEKNKNITDSLTYAKRIQMAMLPNENRIKELFSDFFVFYQPREIVSGDFFWLATDGRRKLLAAIDCTGHGVPGAFMSTLGSALLNQIVNVQEIWSPAEILNQLNKHIAETLNQLNGENRDGMDAAICVYDQTDETLLYAGARNPLVYVRDGELHEIKADKNSVGGFSSFRPIKNFVNHTIQAEKQLNTPYYIFSDGYQDQFGGSEGKKFSSKRLKELFFDIHDKPMQEQKSIVSNRFETWVKQGTEKQIDDVLVIGFRI